MVVVVTGTNWKPSLRASDLMKQHCSPVKGRKKQAQCAQLEGVGIGLEENLKLQGNVGINKKEKKNCNISSLQKASPQSVED